MVKIFIQSLKLRISIVSSIEHFLSRGSSRDDLLPESISTAALSTLDNVDHV